MKQFLDDNFVLQTETAQQLYHEHAKKLPIIDYHCHLDPKLIAENYQFDNLGEIWLAGDHYKWRAMRTNEWTNVFVPEKILPTGKNLRNGQKQFHTQCVTLSITGHTLN